MQPRDLGHILKAGAFALQTIFPSSETKKLCSLYDTVLRARAAKNWSSVTLPKQASGIAILPLPLILKYD
ncbi:MAG: hypothetical protein NTW87_03420 [Planctomycetota bacterium]|nr:hypothetical protein [Planctomycetota bacterium]